MKLSQWKAFVIIYGAVFFCVGVYGFAARDYGAAVAGVVTVALCTYFYLTDIE